MKSGITLERGDLIFVALLQTDLSDGKQRPALVLSDAAYNRSDDVIVCGITSNPRQDRPAITLTDEDLETGSLRFTSVIRPDHIFTIQQFLVSKRVGRIKPLVLEQVQQRLGQLLGIGARD